MKKYEVKITKYALEQMAEIRDYIVYEIEVCVCGRTPEGVGHVGSLLNCGCIHEDDFSYIEKELVI